MTLLHKQFHVCPHCLNEEEVTIWDIIDISQDPDLREEVLQKRIQNFVCSSCQQEWIVAEPFLYHDPQQKLLFYYCPQFAELLREGMPEDQNLPAQIRAALPVEWAQASSDYALRLVTDYNDLIEKIHVFDNDLDDRLMEVLKIAIRTRQLDETAQQAWEQVHFLVHGDAGLLFSVYNEQEDWQTFTLDDQAYTNAEEMLTQLLPNEGQWNLIDMNWAVRFVQMNSPQ